MTKESSKLKTHFKFKCEKSANFYFLTAKYNLKNEF